MTEAESLDVAREALAGERVWLVGGALRDRLSAAPVDDLDLVVDGDVRAAAKRLARAGGGPSFELSDEFGAWRVIGPDRAWQADLSLLRGGSLDEDLALRDFTVNAMAEPLGGGALVDPFGGARRPRRARASAPSARARSPTTRCACCAWRGWRASSAWGRRSGRSPRRPSTRRSSRGSRLSGCSPSSSGSCSPTARSTGSRCSRPRAPSTSSCPS